MAPPSPRLGDHGAGDRAGLTLFVWAAVYHTALPFYNHARLPFADEEAMTAAVLAGARARALTPCRSCRPT